MSYSAAVVQFKHLIFFLLCSVGYKVPVIWSYFQISCLRSQEEVGKMNAFPMYQEGRVLNYQLLISGLQVMLPVRFI